MSIRAMNAAWDLQMPPARKLILMVLADYADEQGRCFPGQNTIARRACLDVRNVRRHLGELERMGYVRVERGKDPATHQRLPNRYQLCLLAPEMPEGNLPSGAGGQPEDSRRAHAPDDPSGGNPQGGKNTSYATPPRARAMDKYPVPQDPDQWAELLVEEGMGPPQARHSTAFGEYRLWIEWGVTAQEAVFLLRGVLENSLHPGSIYPGYLTPKIKDLRFQQEVAHG